MSNVKEFIPLFTPIATPNRKALEYPFSFIGEEHYYIPHTFCKGLPDEEPLDCGAFPNNIIEYYWIHEGENDEEDWMCLCKLNNDCYVFYSASCDYTGFDCQGGMEMIISKDINKLFNSGMCEKNRSMYFKDMT